MSESPESVIRAVLNEGWRPPSTYESRAPAFKALAALDALVLRTKELVAERDTLLRVLQRIDDEAEVADGQSFVADTYYISEDCFAQVKEALRQ